MKVVIFGSTGSIGSELVRQAIERGHEVTAFARDPAKLPERDRVSVARGDVLDPATVESAVRGHDAVLCALGAGRRGRVRSEGTRNIVDAMVGCGVSRLICQSTLGVGASRGNLNFFWRVPMFGFFLRDAYMDHVLQEEHVVTSSLEWTIIRPAAFTDGNRTGRYRHGFAWDDRSLTLEISRADVADFMLNQLDDPAYVRRMPGLSY